LSQTDLFDGHAVTQSQLESRLWEAANILCGSPVDDIDEIVRVVRFLGWQQTSAGEREVKMALRSTLFKHKLHSDRELFEKAYTYIVQYY